MRQLKMTVQKNNRRQSNSGQRSSPKSFIATALGTLSVGTIRRKLKKTLLHAVYSMLDDSMSMQHRWDLATLHVAHEQLAAWRRTRT